MDENDMSKLTDAELRADLNATLGKIDEWNSVTDQFRKHRDMVNDELNRRMFNAVLKAAPLKPFCTVAIKNISEDMMSIGTFSISPTVKILIGREVHYAIFSEGMAKIYKFIG